MKETEARKEIQEFIPQETVFSRGSEQGKDCMLFKRNMRQKGKNTILGKGSSWKEAYENAKNKLKCK